MAQNALLGCQSMSIIKIGEYARATLLIPDIHGSFYWKSFVELRHKNERVVFLGDYFDRCGTGPFAESDVLNFLHICAYARSHADTWLLIGNHDFAYTPFARWRPEPWGEKEDAARSAIMANLDLLLMIYMEDDGVIFSHGGVTQTFLNLHKLAHPCEINRLWREQGSVFEWHERDPLSGKLSAWEGDDPWQSPLWVREKALIEDGVRGFNQVVGHTPVRKPEMLVTKHEDSLLLVCTLDNTLIRIEKCGITPDCA